MFNLILGIFAICFGCYSLYLWVAGKTEKFGKLESMKKTFGEKLGKVIHIIGYVVAPLLVGIVFLGLYFLENNLINQ
jgi:hypothetical protein